MTPEENFLTAAEGLNIQQQQAVERIAEGLFVRNPDLGANRVFEMAEEFLIARTKWRQQNDAR